MKWLTKSLALDLLAITIDGLIRASERISLEPDPVNGDWPPTPQEQPQQPSEAPAPESTPEPQSQQPEASQPQQPAAPQVDAEQLHTKAQEALRAIAMAEGPDWITGELFPKFGVTSLNDIGPEQLPSLITEATRHQQEKAA